MEEQVLWVTKLVNRLLGGPALALLDALHIQPENRQYPVPNHLAMELVVLLFSAVFFLWLKRRISVERPGGAQQCMEILLTNPMGVGALDLLKSIVGHHGERYLPMIGTVGMFVLISNLISLVPGFSSPTAEVTVPLGCAVCVFLYYNVCGLKQHGALGYGKHFMGPVWYLAPLMIPIELISHAARLLSLTVRLWVNMFVSELLYAIFLGLTVALYVFAKGFNPLLQVTGVFPLFVPIIFMGLHIFVAVLQAFVFTILPVVYLSGAVGEEH
jgi:F-type H+-transporting ATPase subunit a